MMLDLGPEVHLTGRDCALTLLMHSVWLRLNRSVHGEMRPRIRMRILWSLDRLKSHIAYEQAGAS